MDLSIVKGGIFMLNPEIRELYTSEVVAELEKLAEDFKAKGIQCWVYGLKDMYGIKAPIVIYYDTDDADIWIKMFEMYQRYTEKLTSEEDEKFGMLVAIGRDSSWDPADIASSKVLWL